MNKCKKCNKPTEDSEHALCNDCVRELWKQAQKKAIEAYEEEWGDGSWDEADKYEREDHVFYEYGLLLAELGIKKF